MGRYRTVETEKDEQSFEARIWWAFWIIALIVIAYTVYHQCRNYDMMHNGTCIEAEYFVYNGQEIARYRDDTGNIVSFNLSGLNAVHDEDTIKLYYKDRINFAEPQRETMVWVKSYVIFGLGLLFCSWKLKKIYSRKPSPEVYSE